MTTPATPDPKETPRTDAQESRLHWWKDNANDDYYLVDSDFARHLERELAAAEQANAALRAREQWHDVATIPPLREFVSDQGWSEKPYVLVVDARGRMSIAYAQLLSRGELHWTMAKPIGQVTHWQPLPAAPALEGGEL